MAIIHLSGENFEQAINTNEVIIVDFYANWCGPWKNLEPVIETVARENPEIQVVKIGNKVMYNPDNEAVKQKYFEN
mgnify:CR=1 FL=1